MHSNDLSLENSGPGDYCNMNNKGLVQGGKMEVEIEKAALVNILRDLKRKGWLSPWVSSASFLGMLVATIIESLNQKC